jgi:hypothetical protein
MKPPLAIRRDKGLGDLVMLTPTLKALSKRYDVTLITTDELVDVMTFPWCRTISYRDVTDEEYRDLNGYVERHVEKESRERWRLFGDPFELEFPAIKITDGVVPKSCRTHVTIPPGYDNRELSTRLIESLGWRPGENREIIGFGLEADGIERNLPRIWTRCLIDELAKKYWVMPLSRNARGFGSSPYILNATGRLTTGGLVGVIDHHCDFIVSPDTGIAHLGVTLRKPTLIYEVDQYTPLRLRYGYAPDYRIYREWAQYDPVEEALEVDRLLHLPKYYPSPLEKLLPTICSLVRILRFPW